MLVRPTCIIISQLLLIVAVNCACSVGANYATSCFMGSCWSCETGFYCFFNCIACNTGCAACTNGMGCNTCSPGYAKISSSNTNCQLCLDANCDQCSPNSATCTHCTLARHGAFLGNCIVCTDSHCAQCSSNAAACTLCDSGYGLVSGTDSCGACVSNCLLCASNNNVCTSCSAGFGVSAGTCVGCQANCNNCQSDPLSCDQCAAGFGFASAANHTCIPCTDTDCTSCSPTADYCTNCNNVTYIGLFNGDCINCIDPNCLWCSANPNACMECEASFGKLNGVGVCTTCNDTNCLACLSNNFVCTQCAIGYGQVGGVCLLCFDPQCTLCSTGIYVCDNCTDSYGVDKSTTNGTCVLCSTHSSNCLQCWSDSSICQICQIGYGFDTTLANPSAGSLGPCVVCLQPNCLTCLQTNYASCTSCPDGRYLDGSTSDCLVCMTNCRICSNGTMCQICNDGYYLNTTSLCDPCPQFCLTCFLNVSLSLPECSTCVAGSPGLNNFAPPVCEQLICGDSITTTLPCDNQIGVAYDGCDDSCQIQTGFNCSVNYTTQVTVCSYYQLLQMNLIGFEYDGLTNKFVIKIAIFPPLNIFKISSQQEIAQIFGFQMESSMVSSITYNSDSGNLEVQGELISDLSSNKVEVFFQPGNSTRLEYFASPNQTLTLSFTMKSRIYFVSKEQLTIMKIVLYLCWTVLVLGWISSVLGLILKRLSGLEALFVIQYAWITLLMFESAFTLPFQQTWPLRYSPGFNYHIFGVDVDQSMQAPYTSYFKLKSDLFYANYNISVAVPIIAAIVLLITKLRIRFFLQKNKITGRELDISQQLEEQQEKLMQQNEIAEQCLLYCSLTNLVYFVCFFGMFIKFGDTSNVLSDLLIAFNCILFLFVFIRFFMNPDPCGYFRYSFRKTPLALSHYYVMIGFLICSTVLVTPAVPLSLVSIAPCGLMLLYTLFYRPYIDPPENVRSVLNLLTMCLFCGLRIYSQLIPVDKFNSSGTYLFLLACILMMVAVVVVSLISGIYYYYHYNVRLVRQNMIKNQNEELIFRKKLLKELVAINPLKQTENVCQKKAPIFKSVIPADETLKVFSNNLLTVQNMLQPPQTIEASSSQNQTLNSLSPSSMIRVPLNTGNITERASSSRNFHLNLLKSEMINKNNKKTEAKEYYPKTKDQSPKIDEKSLTPNSAPKSQNVDTKPNDAMNQNESEYKIDKLATKIAKEENKYINYVAAVNYINDRLIPMECEKKGDYEQAYEDIQFFD